MIGRIDETRMNMKKTVATIPKNKREEIRVSLTEYQGYDLVDVRVYCEPYAGNEWVATKKGISLIVPRLQDLIDGLQTAQRAARKAGLLTEAEPEADTAAPDSTDGSDLTVLSGG